MAQDSQPHLEDVRDHIAAGGFSLKLWDDGPGGQGRLNFVKAAKEGVLLNGRCRAPCGECV